MFILYFLVLEHFLLLCHCFLYVPDFCPLYIDVVCIVNVSVWEAKVVLVALAGPRYFQLGPAGPPCPPTHTTTPRDPTHPHARYIQATTLHITPKPTLNTLPAKIPASATQKSLETSSLPPSPAFVLSQGCPAPQPSFMDSSPFCLSPSFEFLVFVWMCIFFVLCLLECSPLVLWLAPPYLCSSL